MTEKLNLLKEIIRGKIDLETTEKILSGNVLSVGEVVEAITKKQEFSSLIREAFETFLNSYFSKINSYITLTSDENYYNRYKKIGEEFENILIDISSISNTTLAYDEPIQLLKCLKNSNGLYKFRFETIMFIKTNHHPTELELALIKNSDPESKIGKKIAVGNGYINQVFEIISEIEDFDNFKLQIKIDKASRIRIHKLNLTMYRL